MSDDGPQIHFAYRLKPKSYPLLRTWFEQGMIVAADRKIRTDHDLLLPGMASIGVKLREGNFKVKRRDADFGLAQGRLR